MNKDEKNINIINQKIRSFTYKAFRRQSFAYVAVLLGHSPLDTSPPLILCCLR
jgi:hypothetical protein